jgi:HlyD family secretion protein
MRRSSSISRVATVCGALATLTVVACKRQQPDDEIRATGTLEIVEVDVAPTVTGRVVRMLVDEGAAVRAGDTLAVLTQPTLTADIAQRSARVSAASAAANEAVRGPRQAEILRAEADVHAAEAEVTRTANDLERIRPLAERGVVSKQQLDAAVAAAKVAADRRDAARAALRLLREGTRPERITGARAEVEGAKAALASAKAIASDLVLLAPIDGVVMSRNAEQGEVVVPGQSAVTVGDLGRPWVRVYLGEKVVPRIKVGDAAEASLDGVSTRFRGRVVAVSTKAEYTPRVALTEEERADLVFGVKIELEDPSGMLKPGLPVMVTMRPASAAKR